MTTNRSPTVPVSSAATAPTCGHALHAAILRGVEDLTRYGGQPPEQPFRITATKSTLTAELRLLAATEMTEATE